MDCYAAQLCRLGPLSMPRLPILFMKNHKIWGWDIPTLP